MDALAALVATPAERERYKLRSALVALRDAFGEVEVWNGRWFVPWAPQRRRGIQVRWEEYG